MSFRRATAGIEPRGKGRIGRIVRQPLRARLGGSGPQPASGIGAWLAVIAVLGLAFAALVGTFAALAFIVAALLLIAAEPGQASRALLRFSPLLLIALLAMASAIWSDAPPRTLRGGIQLLLTMAAAILVAQRIEARTLIATLFAGFTFICLLAVPYIPAAMSEGVPLFEPFSSKNMLGYAGHLLFTLALAILFDREQPGLARITTIFAMPFALLLVWLSRSAGAQVSVAITLAVFLPLLALQRFHLRWRIGITMLLVALLGVAFTIQPQIEAFITTIRGDVLNKDATLTGRTYLWEFAGRVADERPFLGHGYYAFWRQGNIDAEGLWRWGGIASRTGFNFHNMFVEMRVDLGIVGQALLIATCAGIGVASVVKFLRHPSVPIAFFLGLLAVFYARSFGESVLITPFGITTALWIAAGVYAGKSVTSAAADGIKPSRGEKTQRTNLAPRLRQTRPSRSL